MELIIKLPTFAPVNAEIAQLVEHNLAKVRVASSSLVFRSSLKGCSNGGIGRHEGLKIPWPLRLCGFKSRFEYEIKIAIIWMTNGCDFCFIYLHHICTTELIPGDSSIIFLLAEKGLYFNGRIYEYGNKVKLLQRYFFKCFENLFHN